MKHIPEDTEFETEADYYSVCPYCEEPIGPNERVRSVEGIWVHSECANEL